jgi:cytochrome P450
MLPEVYKIADESFDKIKDRELGNINIIEEIQKITSEVIGRLFFGKKFSEYSIENLPLAIYVERLCSKASTIATDPIIYVVGVNFVKLGILKRHRNYLRKMKFFREYARGIVRDILANLEAKEKKAIPKERISMIEILYEQIKQNPEDTPSEEELVSLFISFFAAGMDSTRDLIGIATFFI